MPKKTKKLNKLSEKYPFIAVPAVLVVILFFITIADLFYKSQFLINKTKPEVVDLEISKYPLFNNISSPFLTANGVVVLDAESGKVLFKKNENVRFAPASTVKIMTALTALELYKLDDTLTVPQTLVDSVVGIKPGEKYKFIDLLYAMMLPSDNRAAQVIASNYSSGEKAFLAKMNENAKKWNLSNTYFGDSVGLDDNSNYTTAMDMARLASIGMQNPILKKIAGTKKITISDLDNKNIYDLENLNKLLDFDSVVGLKTGHTDGAKDVLISAKNDQGHLIILVVMNSDDRFSDTVSLLDFIRGKITFLSIHPK